ncbi:MAG: pyridoxamine 5'-phosphate oxidase family protein [Janthinobacterium lividum]
MSAWSFPRRPGPVEELDADECRRLLGSTSVGRLGYVTPRGPRIVPLNHAVLPDAGTFPAPAPGEIARHAPGAIIAAEADESMRSCAAAGAYS